MLCCNYSDNSDDSDNSVDGDVDNDYYDCNYANNLFDLFLRPVGFMKKLQEHCHLLTLFGKMSVFCYDFKAHNLFMACETDGVFSILYPVNITCLLTDQSQFEFAESCVPTLC